MSLILLRAVPMEKNLKELAKSADNPLSECDKKYHALFRNRSSPRPSFHRKRKIVVAVASTRHRLQVKFIKLTEVFMVALHLH
jgi:hypothetical protein